MSTAADDRVAIETLLADVCWAMDSGNPDALRNYYDEQCVHISPPLTPGGETIRLVGLEELVARQKRGATLLRARQHHHTNIVMEIDGDEALVRTYMTVFVVPVATDAVVKLGLRMRYLARRTDAGWRLSESEQQTLWSENAEALLADLQQAFAPKSD